MFPTSAAWIWDSRYNQHYYVSEVEGCYVYQNGYRVPLPQRNVQVPPSQAQIWPSNSQPIPQNSGVQYALPPLPTTQSRPREDSLIGPSSHDLALNYQALSMRAPQVHQQHNYQQPPTNSQTLDRAYQVQRPGKDFFKFGKVFKCLWPEHLGDAQENVTVFSGPYDEPFTAQIRWFVIITEGWDSCTCLRIQTYSRKGVAKPGLKKSEHAIAYSTREPPKPDPLELPRGKEYGMRPPIRVIPTDRMKKLDPMSRLNYRKPYTVEHNIKVCDFGQVHSESQNTLLSNYSDVWTRATKRMSNFGAGEGASGDQEE